MRSLSKRSLAGVGPAVAAVTLLSAALSVRGEGPDRPQPLRLGSDRLMAPGGLSGVAFSADGSRVYGTGGEGILYEWSAADGRVLRRRELGGNAFDIAVSPDGKTLAAVGTWRGVRLWDLADFGPPRTLEAGGIGGGRVQFSPDGRRLAATVADSESGDNAMAVWSLPDGKRLWKPGAGEGRSGFFVYSPDGRTLVTQAGEGGIRILNAEDGAEVRHLGDVPLQGMGLELTPDGAVAVGFSEGGIRGWKLADGSEALNLGADDRFRPVACSLSPDGKAVATIGRDNRMRIRTVDGKDVREWNLGVGAAGEVNNLWYTPDGRHLAAHAGMRLRLWEAATGREVAPAVGHTKAVTAVAFAADGKTLVSGGADGLIAWSLPDGFPKRLNAGRPIRAAGVSGGSGGAGGAGGSGDGPGAGGDDGSGHGFVGDGNTSPTALAVTRDGRGVWCIDGSAGIVRVDLGGGRAVRTADPTARDGGLWNSALSRDGSSFVFLARLGPQAVVGFGPTRPRAGGRPREIECDAVGVALSEDGKWLATADREGSVTVWDAAARVAVDRLPAHDAADEAETPPAGGGGGAAGAGAGGPFAPGPAARAVFRGAWNGRGGRLIRLPGGGVRVIAEEEAEASPAAVAFSPDGGIVAVVDGQRTVRLLERASGREWLSLLIWLDEVSAMSFSPDGRLLAVAGNRGDVRLFDTLSGTPLARLAGTGSAVRGLAFSPDGRSLATGGEDTVVCVWAVPMAAVPGGGADPARLTAAWEALASADPRAAREAIAELAAHPAEAAALAASRLSPAPPDPLAAEADRLIARLDDDSFAVRVAAHERLRRLGRAAEGRLRAALAGPRVPVETASRLRDLLAGLHSERDGGPAEPSPDPKAAAAARVIARAVRLMERLGTPAAADVLGRWAGGDPSSPLTELSAAAAARMRPTVRR